MRQLLICSALFAAIGSACSTSGIRDQVNQDGDGVSQEGDSPEAGGQAPDGDDADSALEFDTEDPFTGTWQLATVVSDGWFMEDYVLQFESGNTVSVGPISGNRSTGTYVFDEDSGILDLIVNGVNLTWHYSIYDEGSMVIGTGTVYQSSGGSNWPSGVWFDPAEPAHVVFLGSDGAYYRESPDFSVGYCHRVEGEFRQVGGDGTNWPESPGIVQLSSLHQSGGDAVDDDCINFFGYGSISDEHVSIGGLNQGVLFFGDTYLRVD